MRVPSGECSGTFRVGSIRHRTSCRRISASCTYGICILPDVYRCLNPFYFYYFLKPAPIEYHTCFRTLFLFQKTIFVPDEPQKEDVENAYDPKRDRSGLGKDEELIREKDRENGESRRIRPEFFLEKRPDDDDFYEAVNEKIERGKSLGVSVDVGQKRLEMRGDEIIRVFEKLSASEGDDEIAHRSGKKEKDAEDYLEESVESFEDDARDENPADIFFF